MVVGQALTSSSSSMAGQKTSEVSVMQGGHACRRPAIRTSNDARSLSVRNLLYSPLPL